MNSVGLMSNGGMHSMECYPAYITISHINKTITDWSSSCGNEAPTCSSSIQEDAGQTIGHYLIAHEKIQG
jgi:hypothetical protein